MTRNTRSAIQWRIIELRAQCEAMWPSLSSRSIEHFVELDREIDALEVELSSVLAHSLPQRHVFGAEGHTVQ